MIFLHGQESSSQTHKASVMRESYPEIIVPDFSGSLDNRMKALYPILGDKPGWTIIGSSLGGLMGAIFTCEFPEQVEKQVLLAPALMLPEFTPYLERESVSVPTTIIHGTQDEVVPLETTREIAEKVFSNLTYRTLEDNHRLRIATDTLDWKKILA
ncbi:MAG: YqiA/YcfP family alpha/beta fold hydrolase [Anaerolineae bacterium]|nr:YqiA/YcfP family alpha/beta fold hydrolase [Anaerolineae bacterium]